MFVDLISNATLLVIVIFFIALIVGIIFLIQGAPFVKTDDETTQELVEIVKKYKGKRIIDLGSGDGKLIIALAEAGFDVYGIEINPLLVLRSKNTIRKLKLSKYAHVSWGNFWSVNLSKYDIVVLYGIKHIMHRLGAKLEKELPNDAYILTNFFTFPQWKPLTKLHRIVIYKTGK